MVCPEDNRPWSTALPPRSYVAITFRNDPATVTPVEGWAGWYGVFGSHPSMGLSRFSHATTTVLVTEDFSSQNGATYAGNWQGGQSFAVDQGWLNPGAIPLGMRRTPWTHGARTVAVYADGHSEAADPTTLYGKWIVY